MIWMHGLTDGHKCNRCGRAWNEEHGIEMRPSDLNWAHLPAVGAAKHARQQARLREH
ncbi:hypothetical protein SuNHUV7_20380 (plasmid) [Pseudoseohaeicola sp. NH-UV-7]